ncbi:GNAT family N-acetyltransferase [Paracoccus sp. M683]|nr:GNAT family N-acetyltransferase [Paracoccus sp. M683]
MNDILSRSYDPADLAACLAIFDSNLPVFFAAEERDEFRAFLGSANAVDQRPYLVLVRRGVVIACGGLFVETAKRRAALAWGMVDRSLHRQGLGKRLMLARLAQARTIPNIAVLTLQISQHSGGFYQRFGFAVTRITADGFGPGLDRWDMALPLRPSQQGHCR